MPDEAQTGQISADGRWRWNGVIWEPIQQSSPPPPPPPTPALPTRQRSGPSWPVALLIAAGALVFGGLFGIGVGSTTQSNNPSSANAANQSPSPSASPVPSPSPRVLLNVKGSGTKTTQKFTTSGDDWDLARTYNCASFGGRGNFIVDVKNGDGSPSDNQGVNQLGATGADTEHFHSGGTFYLEVVSECSWTVKAIG